MALPTMTSRREAPAVQRGLVVVILTLALTVALVRGVLCGLRRSVPFPGSNSMTSEFFTDD
jgi:hypothetical protein